MSDIGRMLILMSGGRGKSTAKNFQNLVPPEVEVSFGIKACEYSSRDLRHTHQVVRKSNQGFTETSDQNLQSKLGE
jgi:hypothetical protein